MSERDHILIDLVKEVLGPRSGNHEILSEAENPRDEYITGVLAPAKAPRSLDNIDADFDDLTEEVSSEEDQDNQGYVVVPGVFSPALNPKELPRSIGLSFTVEAVSGEPQIEICATWARYSLTQQGWQRQPAIFLTGPTPAARNDRWLAGTGVSLQLRALSLLGGGYRVSIFLVNTTELSDNGRADTPDYLFQPQIRVHCCADTRLVPVQIISGGQASTIAPGSMAAEDESLNLLYRDRTAFARGHLCGVMWHQIDPERQHPSLTSPTEAPFAWTDAALVSFAEKQKFTPADVRTEMVPCYPIETPRMAWQNQFGLSPVLDPEALAETWEPMDVRNSLQPLVDGYLVWLNAQQQLIPTLPTTQQSVAHRHLQQCEAAVDRLQQAIDILAIDEEARLAFCFANKAMALQSRWARGKSLHWRPFQLAFILLNIPALVDPLHPDRHTCDLLWFPTGGGKTEAYLGLTVFTLALRRRRGSQQQGGHNTGAGVGVFSRYTLRLLTIQQFRRALGVITACELLRVDNLDRPGILTGWRPRDCSNKEKFLWGELRFSVGLWVGGNVTPNNMLSVGPIPASTGGFSWYVGALDSLQGVTSSGYDGPDQKLQRLSQQASRREVNGEAAQVLNCPCCQSVLAVPDEGLDAGQHTLHFVIQGGRTTTPSLNTLKPSGLAVTIDTASYTNHAMPDFRTLSLTFTIPEDTVIRAKRIDEWWYQIITLALGSDVSLLAARPSRPGYFILKYHTSQRTTVAYDFEIYCPNPTCELNQSAWAEAVPLSTDETGISPEYSSQMSLGFEAIDDAGGLPIISQMQWQAVLPVFQKAINHPISGRIPIPACTVDDQVYHRCPSLVIATVDKFARLAFVPQAASLFGNVNSYHSRWGYYRDGSPPSCGGNPPQQYQPHPPNFAKGKVLHVPIEPFAPPDLILQDELHLIEGPLGSMVGLYETAVDLLCQYQENNHTVVPKYVASTATVRQAESQVQALFNRKLFQFPPSAISADDRFFALDHEMHPLESERPGRLYVAVCAPGKGAQTPIVRIWSALLQGAYDRWQQNPVTDLDRFWTLVGYFNAIRELAGALSLYRQDIPERINFRAGNNARTLPQDRWLELSSRASSLDLPSLLKRLEVNAPDAQDAVLSTSMFGTGVDVDRLGLMVVHGQPKTTASYIQATGRVGRQGGGLIVTFFRASRPRDLDHYEYFTGYHRALYRYVEPITVAPFSPRARDRGLGPLAVILLRHAREIGGNPVAPEWRVQQRLSGAYFCQADHMGTHRNDPEVEIIPNLLERRACQQPSGRRPAANATAVEAESELDRWASLARQHAGSDTFVYYEPTLSKPPKRHVVLGDAQHRFQGYDEAYENTPQSLREVEETTGFKS
ncbi:MAG: helicase [Ardenticatenales bacterium]|nr:helicase [Ardenticatenales bacterium]